MITGFNTDIEHDGVVYHVQTEDKGVNSPLILSLVYSGGAILASKRSRYEDLIASGFNEEVLADRLKRQHRLICAAINAGRIEDLKRMGGRDGGAPAEPDLGPADTLPVEPASETEPPMETLTETLQADVHVEDEVVVSEEDASADAEATESEQSKESPYTVYDSRRTSPLGEVEPVETGIVLSMMEEAEFRAGETFTIRILVQKQWKEKVKPIASASLSVKILGTTFRPKIYAVKTGSDGVAEVSIEIPSFTSGRAAILVRAAVDGHSKEMRRVINPAVEVT